MTPRSVCGSAGTRPGRRRGSIVPRAVPPLGGTRTALPLADRPRVCYAYGSLALSPAGRLVRRHRGLTLSRIHSCPRTPWSPHAPCAHCASRLAPGAWRVRAALARALAPGMGRGKLRAHGLACATRASPLADPSGRTPCHPTIAKDTLDGHAPYRSARRFTSPPTVPAAHE
jgi:hypothetical protein